MNLREFALLTVWTYPTRSRYKKVMIWPRVQVLPGEKVVGLVPLVIPLLTAHATAWA